jgi:hypothetical protein
MAGAAKAVAGHENPLGRKARVGSSPSARTIPPSVRSDCRAVLVLGTVVPTFWELGTALLRDGDLSSK